MPVTSYSTTAANNNSAPPNGAPEGWAPSAVNDTIRQLMADTAVEAQVGAVKVLGSVAGTDTITASMSPALTAYSTGMQVILIPANTNTSETVTLNINGLGAKTIFRFGTEGLQIGDLVANLPAHLVLATGGWVLVSPINYGFRNIPPNVKTAPYTCVLTDAGKHIRCDSVGGTYTIPANSSVAYPVGTVVSFFNNTAGNITIAINTDTMVLAGTSSSGSRTLAINSLATAFKYNTTGWIISGAGLS